MCTSALASAQQAATDMFADAGAYERFMGRWSRRLAPLLIEFAELPRSGNVLDVGCGTGSLSFEIAKLRPDVHVTGIDPSSGYVRFAVSRKPHGSHLAFETGDAQALRFSSGTFTAAASLLVFNFIPDPLKAVREMRRVTRAGGSVSAAVWEYGAGMEMLRVFWDAASAVSRTPVERDERHMRLSRQGELATLWTEAGLVTVREQRLEIPMRFESLDDLWSPFLLGQGPAAVYVNTLSAAQRENLRQAILKRLALPSPDTAFELKGRAWAVRGTVAA